MRSTFLCLAVCATFVLMTNAEGSLNVDTQEIKDPVQLLRREDPSDGNRNTDGPVGAPPLQPENNQTPDVNGAPQGPSDISQSGGFGDRKKKDLQNKKNEEAKVIKNKKAEGSEGGEEEDEKEIKKSSKKKKKHADEDEGEDADKEEKEEEEEEEGHPEAQAVGFVDAPAGAVSANGQGSASEAISENEFTFRPATLAPEKTIPGSMPKPSVKSNQGVEKITENEQYSGASVVKGSVLALSIGVLGSLYFSF